MDVYNRQDVAENKGLTKLQKQFSDAIFMADDIVTKNYLAKLVEMSVVEPNTDMFIENKKDAVRLIRIDEMVYDKEEYATHKFASVFGAMTTVENSVFLLIDSDGEKATFYMGIRCDDPRREADTQLTTLRSSLEGQFPGIKATKSTEYTNPDIVKLINGIEHGNISSVSCVANLRDQDTSDNKSFLQGLEKFALSLRGNPYTAIILASSLPQDRITEIRHMYEQIYTQLSPFAEQQLAYGNNESWNESASFSEGTSVGSTQTSGYTSTTNTSTSTSIGTSDSESKENTASRVIKGLGTTVSVLGNVTAAALTLASGGLATPLSVGIAIGSNTIGSALSATGEIGKKTYSKSSSLNQTESQSYSDSYNRSYADSKTQSYNNTATYGKSGGTTNTFTLTAKNKTVISLMEKIDKQLERIQEFESYGMWECSAFFVSREPDVSEIAASTYKAIMSGEHTGVEISTVNSWRHNSLQNKRIHEYITNFMQPLFIYRGPQGALNVTAGTFVSGKELAFHMGLPRNSVPGFPVIEHAEFAKEIIRYENVDKKECLAIGQIYTMGRREKQFVKLDVDSLTMHTFVTGSTGAGKSNTIYKLIEQLCPNKQSNTKFLIIEPAKGEYKEVFGGRSDVTVYGTNPFKAPNLLEINPFTFPDDVHVLEHIDRLVEVFNACWPMYAAMPAILKESVEKAYEDCGWNLKSSKNPGRFPTFDDLLTIIPEVVESSAYSNDTSSDYKGALVTRVRSLTRGIHGHIFASDVSSERLFNENVIIDISRVGSSETKALIMGILILKLQEFRMSENEYNRNLQHITVLEEAHNLLRRTSSEQSQESSNLQGKSVEMLANAIAEMRTYGEGFIIADQSPGLMDMSVIRNTNTKIIMRLPDEGDRKLVGKAAGLTDSQIEELSRLEQGVAAISQNDWLEPVLCKIDLFEDKQPMGKQFDSSAFTWRDEENEAVQKFLRIALDIEHLKLNKDTVDKIRKWYSRLGLSKKARYIFENVIDGKDIDARQKMLLIYYMVGSKLNTITVLEEAIDEVERTFYGKYNIEKNEEVILRIIELVSCHFPLNTILDNTIDQIEREGQIL